MSHKKSLFHSFSHKANFMLGVGSTVAVFGIIGFFIMLGITLNGGEDKENNLPSRNVTAAPIPSAPNPSAGAPSAPVDIEIKTDDNRIGSDSAKVKIVEFSDLQCPFCKRFHPTMQRVIKEYGNDVQWTYKHFPLDSIHPNARPAAMASECASDQGKFWEFVDAIFENQTRMSDGYYKELARELGLNGADFDSCLDSNKYAEKVDADYQQGVAAGVQGTPASFINGNLISGAQPYESVKAAIDSLL